MVTWQNQTLGRAKQPPGWEARAISISDQKLSHGLGLVDHTTRWQTLTHQVPAGAPGLNNTGEAASSFPIYMSFSPLARVSTMATVSLAHVCQPRLQAVGLINTQHTDSKNCICY